MNFTALIKITLVIGTTLGVSSFLIYKYTPVLINKLFDSIKNRFFKNDVNETIKLAEESRAKYANPESIQENKELIERSSQVLESSRELRERIDTFQENYNRTKTENNVDEIIKLSEESRAPYANPESIQEHERLMERSAHVLQSAREFREKQEQENKHNHAETTAVIDAFDDVFNKATATLINRKK